MDQFSHENILEDIIRLYEGRIDAPISEIKSSIVNEKSPRKKLDNINAIKRKYEEKKQNHPISEVDLVVQEIESPEKMIAILEMIIDELSQSENRTNENRGVE